MKRLTEKSTGYEAVSPVVGVMLMLTITIIIASIVCAFAGGIAGNTGGSTDIHVIAQTEIVNTGEDSGSKFEIDIISVGAPVSTKDLKLKTFWQTYGSEGNMISKETTVNPGTENIDCGGHQGVSPIGIGPGINALWDKTYANLTSGMNFGNYPLMAGTRMAAYPADEYGEITSYEYNAFGGTDSIQAVLGEKWYELRTGDAVDVMIVHVPTGQIIYDEEVFVNL